MGAIAFSAAAHLWIILAFAFAKVETPPREPEPMFIELVEPLLLAQAPTPSPEPPSPSVSPPTPEKAAPAEPPPPRALARPAKLPPPPEVQTIAAGEGPAADGLHEVNDGDLASATTAGSGTPGGGACDMVGHLQTRLRRDRTVQTIMAEANRGKAIRVWNGRWVRYPGQEGAGLAAVREAIMWEVAFAPEACKQRPVQGMVLLSLNDDPGAARVVLGAGTWRWSDLLFARGEFSDGASLRR